MIGALCLVSPQAGGALHFGIAPKRSKSARKCKLILRTVHFQATATCFNVFLDSKEFDAFALNTIQVLDYLFFCFSSSAGNSSR